ncbi:heparinase, partial [Sinorhizobium meliloti]
MPFSSKTRLLYLYLREGQRRLARLLSRGMTTALRFAGSTPARLIVAPTDLRAIDPFAAEEILA